MSKMKSTLAASLLALVFAFPALGGNIGSPGSSPPPPPPTEGGTDLPGTPSDTGTVLSSATIVDILIALLSVI